MKVEVFYHDGRSEIAPKNSKFSSEALLMLGKHKLNMVAMRVFSLDECVGLLWPNMERLYDTGRSLLHYTEKVCFSKNVFAWKSFLDSMFVTKANELSFDPSYFEQMRWGVKIGEARHDARQA